MPRIARIVIPGQVYHITQRGNNRQDILFVPDDYRFYLELLKEQSERHGLEVLGYGLMTNHVHLVGIPEKEDSLAKALGRAHFLYTQYINRMHGRSGHLWQNRFYSCLLDRQHYWAAMRYVERNPVRANIVRRAWEYPWSSASAHVTGQDPNTVISLQRWEAMSPPDWRAALAEAESKEDLETLRSHTRTGRPLGSDSFLSKLERALGRRLRPLPVGRPKKAVHI